MSSWAAAESKGYYYAPTGLSNRRFNRSRLYPSDSSEMATPTASEAPAGGSPTSSEKALSSLVYQSNQSGRPVAPPSPAGSTVTTASAASTATRGDEDEAAGGSSLVSCFCRCFSSGRSDFATHPAAKESGGAGTVSLLPPQDPRDVGKKCLVLDLDETLVHSSFKPIPKPEYIIPVEIDGMVHHVYVRKRPGCDTFLRMMARHYEIVIFTASLSKYANPLLDKLDPYNYIRSRLYREHCTFHMGNYVKDMTRLGRPIEGSIIVDNSPASYLFQPENAIPCESFIENPADRELLEMIPFLESIAGVPDVRTVLHQWCSPGPGTILGPGPVSPPGDGSDSKSDPN